MAIDLSNVIPSWFPATAEGLEADREKLFHLFSPLSTQDKRLEYIYYCDGHDRDILPGLQSAIKIMHDKVAPEFDFFGQCLPSLLRAVHSIPSLFASFENRCIPVLRQGRSGCVKLSRRQVFALLALSFFQLFPAVPLESYAEVELRWLDLLTSNFSVGVHRIACLLCYFHTYTTDREARDKMEKGELTSLIEDSDDGVVVFERLSLERCFDVSSDAFRDQLVIPEYLTKPLVTVTSTVRIEDVTTADAQVDFANKQVHIGCVIASATQEEVVFSIRPECFLAIVLFECLEDNEAGLVHGAQRYCCYSGYGDTFRFAGTFALEHCPPAVVIIDAVENYKDYQFQPEMVVRDIFKAYLGFRNVKKVIAPLSDLLDDQMPIVATGSWGCGVFRGDPTLKFFQQIMAAVLTRSRLVYTTFGKDHLAKSFEAILFRLKQRLVTFGNVMDWIAEFLPSANDEDADFELFLLEKLR